MDRKMINWAGLTGIISLLSYAAAVILTVLSENKIKIINKTPDLCRTGRNQWRSK